MKMPTTEANYQEIAELLNGKGWLDPLCQPWTTETVTHMYTGSDAAARIEAKIQAGGHETDNRTPEESRRDAWARVRTLEQEEANTYKYRAAMAGLYGTDSKALREAVMAPATKLEQKAQAADGQSERHKAQAERFRAKSSRAHYVKGGDYIIKAMTQGSNAFSAAEMANNRGYRNEKGRPWTKYSVETLWEYHQRPDAPA